jgi:hypothetical protein
MTTIYLDRIDFAELVCTGGGCTTARYVDPYIKIWQSARDYHDSGDLPAAISKHREAIEINPCNPTLRYTYAESLLLDGQYTEGFQNYESRLDAFEQLDEKRNEFPYPDWQGEALDGKILLLYHEQGAGDFIMFLRFLSMIRKQYKPDHILLEVPSEFFSLIEVQESLDADLIFSSDSDVIPDADFRCSLASLPHWLGIDPTTLDGSQYLAAAAGSSTSTTPRIGYCWQGSSWHGRDWQRSIPLEWFRELMHVEGQTAVSLQKGWNRSGDVEDSNLDTWLDTATVVSGLDLVVTVDTSVAHLAGAMGKPTLLLLSKIPDWRWRLDGDQSAWYASMILFRQAEAENWSPVITNVKREIKAYIKQRRV